MAAHTITLTNGAAHILAQLSAAPGLLTDPADLYRAGEFAEKHLADLPKAPTQPSKDAGEAGIAAWATEYKAWANAEIPAADITERTRDTLKKLVKTAIEKGAVPGGPPINCLMRAFGLAPEA